MEFGLGCWVVSKIWTFKS